MVDAESDRSGRCLIQQIHVPYNAFPCAKAVGRSIITLLAPEFVDVPEAVEID